MDTQSASPTEGDRATIAKWLQKNSFGFAGGIVFYLLLHPVVNYLHGSNIGWESVALDKAHIQTLNAILLVPTEAPKAPATPAKEGNKQQPQGTDSAGLVLGNDTLNPLRAPSDETLNVARQYIINELGDVDSAQLDNVLSLLKPLPAQAGVAYLLSQKFRVKSFFWLTGSQAYCEIIFWSLFGVLASILFIVSCSLRTQNDNQEMFDVNDIPYQKMKLFYAPACILILIFGYNLISDDSLADLQAGKGMLIFAFITGFYSGRMMTLLNRLKEVVLPGDNPKPTSTGNTGNQPLTADDLIVTIALDSASLAPDVHTDITENDLDKTVVILMNEAGTLLTTLERTGEDQGGKFVARQIPDGAYKLDAHLSTEDGNFNFSGESGIVVSRLPNSRSVTLTLGLNQAVG